MAGCSADHRLRAGSRAGLVGVGRCPHDCVLPVRRPGHERLLRRVGGPVLEVRDLVVTYGGVVQALRGVSLTVEEGAVVALLGSNGAGKTTLLRTLSGTLRLHRGRVEAGEVLYRGESLKGRDPAQCVSSGLVQVPEGRRIFTRLTVEENLRAGGSRFAARRALG